MSWGEGLYNGRGHGIKYRTAPLLVSLIKCIRGDRLPHISTNLTQSEPNKLNLVL